MSGNMPGNDSGFQPLGIGYCKLVWNENNKAEDCIILRADAAFEELTGWSMRGAQGKRASELLANADPGGQEWLNYCESVVRSGRSQETTQWIKQSRRYLKVTVVPMGKTTFALALQNAADEPAAPALFDRTEEPDPLPEDVSVLFNKTHDAISIVEHRGGEFRYVRNNAVHQGLTGVSSIRGMTPEDLVGEEVGAKLRGHYERCVRTGKPVSYEQHFNFAPGKRVWQTEVTPMLGKNGIRYLLCSSKDVSDLKKAQDEKVLLTERLKAMFTQHSAVMLMIDQNSGRVIDANPAACEFYGYSAEELRSLSIDEISELPPDELARRLVMTREERMKYFIAPHRLKNGDVRLVDVYSCPISDGADTLLYSIIFDVTDREAYRQQLYREKEVLLTTLRSIGDGVVTTDNAGIITSLNGVAQEITGWEGDSAVGHPFGEVFLLRDEETGAPTENPIQKVRETGRIIGLANHTVLINRRGEAVPISDSAAPIKMENGQTFGVVMVFRDVTMEKENDRQIRFLSYHDPLTGLHNRRYIEEVIGKGDPAEYLPLAVIMGDVNGLKITNDVFGHHVGDKLLRHVADLLEKNCRKHDLTARWGGDEFMVILPKAGLKEAEELIRRIRRDDTSLDESGLRLSLSLGCAVKDSPDRNLHDVMREAEENMYHQKLLDGKSYRNAIINTLLATLYEKSMETEEHAKRIEFNCHLIGRHMQLSTKEMDELSLLAILHDIGKVGVNPDILKKPGSLSPAEWEEMKRHPEIGYRIVQATPELANIADFILSHHERWDGGGYPRGLKRDEIPLVCRILAVTDAYDAMINDRVYRKAMRKSEAIRELKKNSGSQFDPAVVDLFLNSIDADGIE